MSASGSAEGVLGVAGEMSAPRFAATTEGASSASPASATRAAPRTSLHVLRIAAALGLPAPAPARSSRTALSLASTADRRARTLARRLRHPCIILLSGPSGSGKSTLLRAIHRRCPRAITLATPPRSSRPIADLVRPAGDAWLETLSAAGLADGRLWLLPPGALSTGQSARLRIALAMWRAQRTRPTARPRLLLIDDLGCGLDAPTRCSLARALARWCRRARIALLAATVHDEFADFLHPDLVVATSLAALTTLALEAAA